MKHDGAAVPQRMSAIHEDRRSAQGRRREVADCFTGENIFLAYKFFRAITLKIRNANDLNRAIAIDGHHQLKRALIVCAYSTSRKIRAQSAD